MNDKMYICVLDEVPDYMVPTLVAHAVLRHHMVFVNSGGRYDNWLSGSFRKCVVKVNRKEFAKIQALPEVVESWESTTLGGEVSCLTLVGNPSMANVIKFAKLWKPKELTGEDVPNE